jgi:hypothetical protein
MAEPRRHQRKQPEKQRSAKRSLTVEKRAYFFNQSVPCCFLQLHLCIVRDLNILIVGRVLSRLSLSKGAIHSKESLDAEHDYAARFLSHD